MGSLCDFRHRPRTRLCKRGGGGMSRATCGDVQWSSRIALGALGAVDQRAVCANVWACSDGVLRNGVALHIPNVTLNKLDPFAERRVRRWYGPCPTLACALAAAAGPACAAGGAGQIEMDGTGRDRIATAMFRPRLRGPGARACALGALDESGTRESVG